MKGDLDGADAELHEARRLKPDEPSVYWALGGLYLTKHDPSEAEKEFREAIRLKPDYADAHLGLGWALEGQGDLNGAIAEYHEALHLQPNFPLAGESLTKAELKKVRQKSRG